MADFWCEQLEKAKTQLVALDEAIAALEGGAFSYSLDTGQSRQSVTKQQVGSLYSQQKRLLARIAELEAKCFGQGAVARPGF